MLTDLQYARQTLFNSIQMSRNEVSEKQCNHLIHFDQGYHLTFNELRF
jgi:hypothetical protein